MRTIPTSLALASGTALIAAVLSGCGDAITANHDWYALASHTSSQETFAPGDTTITDVYNGPLLTGRHGEPIPGTLIHKACTTYIKGGVNFGSSCQLFLNAGRNAYVANGQATYPTNPTLVTEAPPYGRIIVTTIGADTKTVLLKVSARTGIT
jgi:hypothetical protein